MNFENVRAALKALKKEGAYFDPDAVLKIKTETGFHVDDHNSVHIASDRIIVYLNILARELKLREIDFHFYDNYDTKKEAQDAKRGLAKEMEKLLTISKRLLGQ